MIAKPTRRKVGDAVAAIDSWIESATGKRWLLLILGIAYLIAYFAHPNLPGNNPSQPFGWWGWWDQSEYLKCAADLAQGHLSSQSYWYPLGYSLLGAVSYRWTPEHAFLLPNLALALGIGATFYRIARRFISPLEAIVLMAILVCLYPTLTSMTLVVPWNTIPTHFLSYSILLLVGFSNPTSTRILAAGFCLAAIYLCRPGDAVCMATVIGLAIIRRPWKEQFRSATALSAIWIFVWGAVLLTNHAVFRSWKTPYEKVVAEVGFNSYPFFQKLFLLFYDGTPVFHEQATALLYHFPWLVLTIPGIFCVWRRSWSIGLSLLSSVGATYAIYVAFNDFWPSNVFRYYLIHYLAWTVPLLALLGYLGLKEAWHFRAGRWSFLLALLFLLPLWFLTLKENVTGSLAITETLERMIPASADQPVDWITFKGVKDMPRLRQGGRDLVPFSDFKVAERADAKAILLGKSTRTQPISFDAPDSAQTLPVEFGRLEWKIQWAPKAAIIAAASYFVKPRARMLGKSTGVDLAGPDGEPDGQPDEVIELELARPLLPEIVSWDLESTDHTAHWVSVPNLRNLWLIKTLPVALESSQLRSGIRLYLPDFGQLENAAHCTLRGHDASGRVCFKAEIHANRIRVAP